MMKKMIAILLAMVTILSLAACGSQSEDENMQTAIDAGDGLVAVGGEENMIFGKVTSMVGNEIKMKVGTLPEISEEEDEPNEDVPAAGGDSAAAAPAVLMSEETYELDYTGETMEFIANSGIKIMSMGQECSLANIKEGSVIGIIVEDANAEQINVKEIVIVN